MAAKKTYTCGRCGNEVDTKTARKMGGRYWHFECPDQARDRAWREIVSEAGKGKL